MRKIISKEQSEKRKNRNQLIVGLILIGVMLIGIFGYSFQGFLGGNSAEKIKYNGFEFTKQNYFWVLESGNNNFIFKYNPEEVERVSGYVAPIGNYLNKPVYIFSENKEAELEIYRNVNPFVQRVQEACLEGEKCDENLPIKTCKDSFIIIKEGNFSSIIQNENCVFIEGKQEDLVKLSDEFLFKIFGVEG